MKRKLLSYSKSEYLSLKLMHLKPRQRRAHLGSPHPHLIPLYSPNSLLLAVVVNREIWLVQKDHRYFYLDQILNLFIRLNNSSRLPIADKANRPYQYAYRCRQNRYC